MTIQIAVEEIRQIFSNVMEAQIINDLDKAQKEFVRDTECLEVYVALTDINSNYKFALPADYNSFKEILAYDANNNPVSLKSLALDYEIGYGYLFFKSLSSITISALPAEINKIYLGYYKQPVALTAVTSSFSVPDEYAEGIVSKVMEYYYSKFPVDTKTVTGEIVKTRDFQAVSYYKNKVKEYEIRAKKWRIRKNNTGAGNPFCYGMPGYFELPQRTNTP